MSSLSSQEVPTRYLSFKGHILPPHQLRPVEQSPLMAALTEYRTPVSIGQLPVSDGANESQGESVCGQ